jgi:hypothetical protein
VAGAGSDEHRSFFLGVFGAAAILAFPASAALVNLARKKTV